jgi:rhodanese-related sulfurtransferase
MTTLPSLPPERVQRILDAGGLGVDLRSVDGYLARHAAGTIPLLYEAGPGLGGRARDLLPLDARIVLLADGTSPLDKAADSFRGKGFEVVGYVEGGVDAWPGEPVGTPQTSLADAPVELVLIDVADPGTLLPPERGAQARIPAERLWARAEELHPTWAIGVLAGWGVRAAAAVGILEKLGFGRITFVRTRRPGEKPPMAEPAVFRAGGPP